MSSLSGRRFSNLSKENLLRAGDPAPVLQINPSGASDWLLVCDHAGNTVPRRLDGLGLEPADLSDHIAVDVGVWALTRLVSIALNAEAIGQTYSRLIVDSNRRPGTPASIPEISDSRTVPANLGLSAEDRAARIVEIFEPYHQAIAESIERRRRNQSPLMLCAMHSFTRELAGERRSVDIGIIHGPDSTIADKLLAQLITENGVNVRRNAPYQIDFVGDYTLPVHAEQGKIPYVEIEICQDLIATEAGQTRIADLLTPALRTVSQENRL